MPPRPDDEARRLRTARTERCPVGEAEREGQGQAGLGVLGGGGEVRGPGLELAGQRTEHTVEQSRAELLPLLGGDGGARRPGQVAHEPGGHRLLDGRADRPADHREGVGQRLSGQVARQEVCRPLAEPHVHPQHGLSRGAVQAQHDAAAATAHDPPRHHEPHQAPTGRERSHPTGHESPQAGTTQQHSRGLGSQLLELLPERRSPVALERGEVPEPGTHDRLVDVRLGVHRPVLDTGLEQAVLEGVLAVHDRPGPRAADHDVVDPRQLAVSPAATGATRHQHPGLTLDAVLPLLALERLEVGPQHLAREQACGRLGEGLGGLELEPERVLQGALGKLSDGRDGLLESVHERLGPEILARLGLQLQQAHAGVGDVRCEGSRPLGPDVSLDGVRQRRRQEVLDALATDDGDAGADQGQRGHHRGDELLELLDRWPARVRLRQLSNQSGTSGIQASHGVVLAQHVDHRGLRLGHQQLRGGVRG